MKIKTRKLIYIVCAIISLLIFFLALYLPIQPRGNILNEGWFLKDDENLTPIQLPFQKDVEGIETLTFTTTFSYTSGDALILTWPKGQAIRVLLNGRMIFMVGDAEQPTANFWNSTFLVYLPESTSPQNTLEIQLTSASFPVNLSMAPYVIDEKEAEWRVLLINFLYNDVLLSSIGGAMIIGFLLITLSLILKKGWSADIFLGLASILGAIECYDFVFRISTGTLDTYLLVKKVMMIAGYISALCFVAGAEKYYQDRLKISRYLAIPTFLTVLLLVIVDDLVFMTNLFAYFNSILLIDLFIGVVLITKGGRGKDWLLIPAVWLMLALMQMIVVEIFSLPWPYVLQYVILSSTMLFGFNLLVEFNRIYAEKSDLEKRVVRDSLTNAYNRNVLSETSPNKYDVLILMDLDNFKSYNDKYGHQKGDQLLIQFAEIVKQNLRSEDLVVRYGGDEFLVLLSEIGIIDAEQVAMRIRLQFEQLTKEDNLSVSYGIEKIEHSLDTDFYKADRLMYAMKQAKNLHSKVSGKEP